MNENDARVWQNTLLFQKLEVGYATYRFQEVSIPYHVCTIVHS